MREEALRKIFWDFYDYILMDPYLSYFIPSYKMVKDLIDRQVMNTLTVATLIEEGKTAEAFDRCLRIAKVHTDLRIHESFMYESLDFLRERVKKSADFTFEGVKLFLKFLDMMEEAVGKVTSLELLEEALELLEVQTDFQLYHYRWLEDLRRFVKDPKRFNPPELDHTACELGKAIGSVAFTLKTYNAPELKLKLEVEHKDLHNYTRMFVSLYRHGQYRQALVVLRSLLRSSLIVSSLLKDIENYWKANKEKIIPEFLRDESKSGGILYLIVEPTYRDNSTLQDELAKLLRESFASDKNTFVFSIPNRGVYFYVDRSVGREESKALAERLKEIVRRFAKDIRQTYMSMAEGNIFSVALLETERLIALDPQIVRELLITVEATLKKEGSRSKELATFVDFSTKLDELIKFATKRVSLRKRVVEALEEADILLFGHEIWDLKNGKIKGVELLVRIKDGNGIMPAYEFLPIVEEENLNVMLDKAVISKALTLLDSILSVSENVFLNVYPSSLSSKEVVTLIDKLARSIRDKGGRLFLELTEHTLFINRDIMEDIEGNLIGVAFDDFGSGYTNFELVGSLAERSRADILKVDGSIVKAIDSKVYYSMVKSISNFAKESGLGIIYEFVENESIFNKLVDIADSLGMEAWGQGWLLSKPKEIG